jgi:serine phosphatase RsbU (regulator of sigma subunit)
LRCGISTELHTIFRTEQKSNKKQKKKGVNQKRQFMIILGILFFIQGIISDFSRSFQTGNVKSIVISIILWGLVAFILWNLKDRFKEKKQKLKEKFENSDPNISITDASLFSITWFRELYTNIPQDRKKIIQMSFILISCALVFLFLKFGNLTYIITAGIIIFAGIGLLLWTVTSEREERDKLHDELIVAREVQMSLMPKTVPEFNDFDVFGLCIPAKEVGGDIYDFVKIDGNNLSISLMDVSGKGLNAAFTGVFMSGAFASEIKNTKDINKIMFNLNSTLSSHSVKGKFVTFFLSIFDQENKILKYVNAGQPKPVFKRDNEVKLMDSNGIRFPLGMKNDVVYSACDLEYKKGDLFIFYTDGISEAMNADQELYTSLRLQNVVLDSEINSKTSEEICNIILNDVKLFTNSTDLNDDIAMIVIKI